MFSNIFYNARAIIKGNKEYPRINGIVTFKQTKNGIILTADIRDLPQANDSCSNRFFGFHIHEGTSCTGNTNDEFANAKGHLNLNNCTHPFHTGDLPPLMGNDGYAYMSVFTNKFTIKDIIRKSNHYS